MSEPYYEDDLVKLYHGDCREVTPWLEADVLVTDPPYGMSRSGKNHGRGRNGRAVKVARIEGDASTRLRDEALAEWGSHRPALVFGTWQVPRPRNARSLIVWHKLGAGGMGDLSIPWMPTHEEIYVLGSGFTGGRVDGVLSHPPIKAGRLDRPDHPTPKPVPLMERLLQHTNGTVSDPFVGSGATLRAAKNLGRRAIGVEIDERYCEIAANRLTQDTLFGGVA